MKLFNYENDPCKEWVYLLAKAKAVSLHTMKVLGGRGDIAL
jgi:hypothetical protein